MPVRSAVLSPESPTSPPRSRRCSATWASPCPAWPSRPGTADAVPAGAVLKGFYSGGTLADEAMLIAAPVLGDIRSNTPLRPELDLDTGKGTDLRARGTWSSTSATTPSPWAARTR